MFGSRNIPKPKEFGMQQLTAVATCCGETDYRLQPWKKTNYMPFTHKGLVKGETSLSRLSLGAKIN